MVGIVPKILVGRLMTEFPESAPEILSRAGISETATFRLNETYPDESVLALVSGAQEILGMSAAEFARWYADIFMTDVIARFPRWRQMAPTARAFLELQPAIHNGFATAIRDPESRRRIRDKFRVVHTGGGLITRYRSPNMLCGLYVALAEWVVDHYGEKATVSQTRCMLRGDLECEILVRWEDQP